MKQTSVARPRPSTTRSTETEMRPRFELGSLVMDALEQSDPKCNCYERRESKIPGPLRPNFTLVDFKQIVRLFRFRQTATTTTRQSVQMSILEVFITCLSHHCSMLLQRRHSNSGSYSLSGTLSHGRHQRTRERT